MKTVIGALLALLLSSALAQVPTPRRSVPTLSITPTLQITLYRPLRTVERSAARKAITLVYRSTEGEKIFMYYYRDLLAHGWTKLTLNTQPNLGEAALQKGGHKASLKMTQSGERVEVTIAQD